MGLKWCLPQQEMEQDQQVQILSKRWDQRPLRQSRKRRCGCSDLRLGWSRVYQQMGFQWRYLFRIRFDDLTSFIIVMELRWFGLLILFVLNGAIVGLTFFRVNPSSTPSSWRTSVENNLHLLCWVTEVKFAFISHVLEVDKITSSWSLWFGKPLLVQVMESGIAT